MTRAVRLPLGVGAVGLALGLVEVAIDPRRALFAYAAAFVAVISIALGSLLLVMIAHTAGARWFVVLRRVTSAIAATMPAFLVLFLPVALGLTSLYPWARSGSLPPAQREWATHARPWLSVPFFLARSYGYLIVWNGAAWLLRGASVAGDTRPSAALVRRERTLSAVALPVMALTLTFASFDWVMSMNPGWASDMMGVYLFAGAFVGALGVTAVASFFAVRAGLLPAAVGPAHAHALGRLLLVGVIFWAYIAFCQFLLVWMADIPRESSFYVDRGHGTWAWVSAALFAGHFAGPFLILLSRAWKQSLGRVALVGAWLACAHALDVTWLVLPPLHAGLRWLDPAFVVGIAGVCAAFGAWRFAAARPYPVHDPELGPSLRYESS